MDFSKITIGGVTGLVKDATARTGLATAQTNIGSIDGRVKALEDAAQASGLTMTESEQISTPTDNAVVTWRVRTLSNGLKIVEGHYTLRTASSNFYDTITLPCTFGDYRTYMAFLQPLLNTTTTSNRNLYATVLQKTTTTIMIAGSGSSKQWQFDILLIGV